MTKDEAMKQALEAITALREWIGAIPDELVAVLPAMPGTDADWLDEVEAELEKALAQPAQPAQEPVAWGVDSVMEQAQVYAESWAQVGPYFGFGTKREDAALEKAKLRAMLTTTPPQPEQEPVATLFGSLPVYDSSPPQRTWVGLTDDERKEVFRSCESKTPAAFLIAIEAKLKEKNT